MAKARGKRGDKLILSIMVKEQFINDPQFYTSYEFMSYALRSDGHILTRRLVNFKQIHELEPPGGIDHLSKWKKNDRVAILDVGAFEEKFARLGFSKMTYAQVYAKLKG